MPISAPSAHRVILKYCPLIFFDQFQKESFCASVTLKMAHFSAYRIFDEGPGKSLDLYPTVLDTRSRLLFCQAPSGGLENKNLETHRMLEQLYSAPPILGLVGLAIAFFIYTVMSRREISDGEVQKIGEQIHLGAMVFMKREYTYLFIFAVVLLGLILLSDLGNDTALSFVVGASSSALALSLIHI